MEQGVIMKQHNEMYNAYIDPKNNTFTILIVQIKYRIVKERRIVRKYWKGKLQLLFNIQ